jgi:hypothetical protein
VSGRYTCIGYFINGGKVCLFSYYFHLRYGTVVTLRNYQEMISSSEFTIILTVGDWLHVSMDRGLV